MVVVTTVFFEDEDNKISSKNEGSQELRILFLTEDLSRPKISDKWNGYKESFSNIRDSDETRRAFAAIQQGTEWVAPRYESNAMPVIVKLINMAITRGILAGPPLLVATQNCYGRAIEERILELCRHFGVDQTGALIRNNPPIRHPLTKIDARVARILCLVAGVEDTGFDSVQGLQN